MINKFYRDCLRDLAGIEFIPEAPHGKSNCWLTVILINPEEFDGDREAMRLALEKGISNPGLFGIMRMQPVFKGCRVRGGKVSEDLFKRGFCLPSGAQMTEEDLGFILHSRYDC